MSDIEHVAIGAIFTALHGESGSIRTLVLERDGRQLTVPTKVTAF